VLEDALDAVGAQERLPVSQLDLDRFATLTENLRLHNSSSVLASGVGCAKLSEEMNQPLLLSLHD
jgi:hypothetical protein